MISDELLQEIEEEIRANRRVAIRELHHVIPEVTKTTVHEAVTEKLGHRKLCARWVSKMLTGRIYWTIRRTVRTTRPAISTCFFT